MGRSEKTASVWTKLDGLHPYPYLPETKPDGSKGIYPPSTPLQSRLANLTTFGVERICSRETFLHSPQFSKARGKAHVRPGLSAAALFDSLPGGFDLKVARHAGNLFSPSPPFSFTLGTGRGQAEAKTRGSLFLAFARPSLSRRGVGGAGFPFPRRKEGGEGGVRSMALAGAPSLGRRA